MTPPGKCADVALTCQNGAARAEDVVAEIEALGRRGLALRADSADPAAVRAAVDAAVEALGGLDILMNNAGIARVGAIAELTLDDITDTLAVNVRAPLLAAQAAATHLPEGGRIISIGSNLAEQVPDQGFSLYSMSKAALVGMTRGLARDLGPRGITVNIVHPGSTDTDMNPADGPHADGQRARMAIPRYGRPDDIAGLVAWLAGPEGRFVTGAGFTIDGGANA